MIEDQGNDCSCRRLTGEPDDARALLRAGPFELFLLGKIRDLLDPRRIGVDLGAIPVALVERVHSLLQLDPNGRFLAGLQNAVAVALALGHRALDRAAAALVAFLPEHRE